MHYYRLFTWIVFLCIPCIISAQNDVSNSAKTPADELTLDELSVIYGPLFEEGVRAEMIEHGVLMKMPGDYSHVYDLTIPSGDTVLCYNYFRDSNCWLVKYNDYWGFLSNYSLKSIGENKFHDVATEFSKPPQLLDELKPEYPRELKKRGIGGKVVVRVCIDKEGNVTRSMIRESIPQLNKLALEAIHKVKFKPAETKKGEPIEVCIDIAIDFE